jgi:YhcH/YjgK/YiaL family protein
MIVDSLKNASMYYGLGERIARAFQYLQHTDLDAIAPGRYEVNGAQVFALVQQYDSKPREKGMWESHRQYFDIQYVHEGVELMGYADLSHQAKVGAYDASRDFVPSEGPGEFFQLRAGSFALLAPQDAHMPQIAHGLPAPVKKIVMKVAV